MWGIRKQWPAGRLYWIIYSATVILVVKVLGQKLKKTNKLGLSWAMLPNSPRIFDKNHDILGFAFTFSIILITFWGSRVRQKDTESLGWARLSDKSYKIECFYFWQYVLWPPTSPTFVKKSFHFNLDNVFKYTGGFFRVPLTKLVLLYIPWPNNCVIPHIEYSGYQCSVFYQACAGAGGGATDRIPRCTWPRV